MKLISNLKTLRFEEPHSYPCVFRKVVGEQMEMVVAIHVDDILVTRNWAGNMNHFVTDFNSRFKIKHLGKAI